MSELQYEAELELTDENSEYDREARGKLVIDGPDGRLVILKTYRAMVGDERGLMDTETIREYSAYYREGETEQFTDASHEWDVPEDDITDDDAFLDECRAALEADPEIEYEQVSDRL